MLREAIEGTMTTTAMVMLIILAAIFPNFVLAVTGRTALLTSFITRQEPSYALMVIVAFYPIFDCFLEPFPAPITSPIRDNLYVVQEVRGRCTMNDVIIGALPFVVSMFIMVIVVILLVIYPNLALWLPKLFYGS